MYADFLVCYCYNCIRYRAGRGALNSLEQLNVYAGNTYRNCERILIAVNC